MFFNGIIKRIYNCCCCYYYYLYFLHGYNFFLFGFYTITGSLPGSFSCFIEVAGNFDVNGKVFNFNFSYYCTLFSIVYRYFLYLEFRCYF